MSLLIIFILLITAVFSYLLFAPFYIEINSIAGVAAIRFHRVARAELVLNEKFIGIKFRITGWEKQFNLLSSTSRRAPKAPPSSPEKKNKYSRISFNTVKAVIKSFKIDKFYLNVDSGSMQLNGMLYPGFYWLGRYCRKPISINFFNRNEIVLEIKNNCARILTAIIYSTLKTKYHGKFK